MYHKILKHLVSFHGLVHNVRIPNLKGIVGVYYFGVIFAVKTALWLLKPGTQDLRLDPFQGFSSWYFWIPGQDTKTNKEKVCSTI